MQKLISFKKNIFKKNPILAFSPKHPLCDSPAKIIKLKEDLEKIKKGFGDYKSRETILIHSRNLPPKTRRCLVSILKMDSSISHSTNYFTFNQNNDARLEIIINFKKNKINDCIGYVNKIVRLFEIINEKAPPEGIRIVTSNIAEYPTWLSDYLKNNSLKKGQTIEFISEIQHYYASLGLMTKAFDLEGDFILSFSSDKTKNEFIRKNDLRKFKILENGSKIIANGSQIVDKTNIISFSKNHKIKSILSKKAIQPNDLFTFEKPSSKCPTIGVLDSKMDDNSHFKSYIKVTNMVNSNEPKDHGEAVSSIALAGDYLNDFDDGCGPFNVHLFEVVEDKMGVDELVKRIEIAIKANLTIKVWNLSVNVRDEEAYDGGKITWFAAEIDRIQKQNGIVIVQSAGNKRAGIKSIQSPSDATQSLVVNATKSLAAYDPAEYALKGNSDYFTRKPDFSFFGGGGEKKVKVVMKGRVLTDQGTSFAAPFVARKIAHLIYYENKSILEAKTLLIHAAYFNSCGKQDAIQTQKNGWGVLPKHISDITNTKDHAVRFIFNEKVRDTQTSFVDLKIPQSTIQEYSIIMTYLSSATLDEKFGCEYVRSSVNMNMGVTDKNSHFISNRKLKKTSYNQKPSDGIMVKENKLISFYGKWKLTDCLKDIIKKERQGPDFKNYGVEAKIDKRINVIKDNIVHNVVCVVTITHKDGKNKYASFLELNNQHIDVDYNVLKIGGELDLKSMLN